MNDFEVADIGSTSSGKATWPTLLVKNITPDKLERIEKAKLDKIATNTSEIATHTRIMKRW